MSFSQNDVIKIADMARLDLDQSSLESIAKDMSNILELVSQISNIEANVSPMEHTQNVSQPCRKDEVNETNVRDVMQALVPPTATAAGLYLVPKVVDNAQ